jgi:hypothetical protein
MIDGWTTGALPSNGKIPRANRKFQRSGEEKETTRCAHTTHDWSRAFRHRQTRQRQLLFKGRKCNRNPRCGVRRGFVRHIKEIQFTSVRFLSPIEAGNRQRTK